MLELTLVPAYSRDYKTIEAVVKDWKAGKDFRICTVMSPDDGRYTSISDLSSFPGEHVKIRFDKLREFILVNVKTGSICGSEANTIN